MKRKFIVLMNLLFMSFVLLGQPNDDELRIIPTTPEAALFDQNINTPNLTAKGTMSINIPIYTIDLKDFSLSIFIYYVTS
ncbi:hypothetical protein [Marinifilum fragile]|uniref:hypothetical protein n=1 Tax=Marinifilum fragile TaxID=570161 RepID=UPI002AAB9BE2|nr:hypothetical protein [Marinifilum fragile]